MKQVPIEVIQEIVDKNGLKDLRASTACGIVLRNYCVPLNLKGICPGECEKCQAHLENMFRLQEAHNKEALLTWMARDEQAKMAEEFAEARRPKKPVYDEDFNYGASDVGNILKGLLDETET